ncbi:MAG: hypothetical protein ACI4RD_02755 [Kiritimatiellia bacterium]
MKTVVLSKQLVMAVAVLSLVAGDFCAFADDETAVVRYWSGRQAGLTLQDPGAWEPSGAPAADDTLYINSTDPAALAAGEEVAVSRMYVGSGSRWNESTSNVEFSAAYDLGARLDVTGGRLIVTNRLDVGGTFSDNSNVVMTVSGEAEVSVGGLRMGDCASNNGKRNTLTVTNATFAVGAGNARLAPYVGGTVAVEVLDGGFFTSQSTVYVGGGGNATMTVDGGRAEFAADETMVGCANSNRQGTLAVSDGELVAKTIHVGRDGGTGLFELSGGRAVLSNSVWYGTFNLGWAGMGRLKLSGDAELRISGGPLAVGRTSTGQGAVEMTGGTIDVVDGDVNIAFERNADTGAMAEGTWTMSGGSVTANNVFVGSSGPGEMRVTGGAVTSRGWTRIGRNACSEGRLTLSDASFASAYGVVVGSKGKGTLELERGTYADLHEIIVALEEGEGVLRIHEGARLTDSYINMGRASGSRALAVVDGGEIDSTYNVIVACAEGSVGELVVNGGRAKFGADIWIGEKGLGTLTLNGGELLCTYWLDLVRLEENTEKGCTLNLNGGELQVGLIHTAGDATVNWNGGVFKPNGNYESVFVAADGVTMTVNVLKRGAIFDASGRDRVIDQALTGVGAFTLRGSDEKVYVRRPWKLKGGFIVEGGALVLEAQPDPETGVMKQIEVAEGATLDLGGAEVSVLSYRVAGEEMASGIYAECNGTIHVLGGIDPATATFTNAAGDGDTANTDNWIVRNASGQVIVNALPTAETVVTVPYGGVLADWSHVPAKTVVTSFAGEQQLHSPVRVPEAIATALAWYDLADTATVTVEDGLLTGVLNKGTGGARLDGVVTGSRSPAYGLDTLNGLNVMSMTNTHGFISKEGAGIADEQDRTLIVLTRQYKDRYYNGEKLYNQNFPIGIETGGDYGTFRIEWGSGWRRYFYNAKTLSMPAQSDWDEWAILSMDSESSVVAGTRWTASEGLVSSTGGGSQTNLETSAEAKISVGYRRQFATTSAGAVAEATVIARKLTDAEMSACRDYLRVKWFDYVNPADLPTDIALADATLDLNGAHLSLAFLAGSGAIANGTVAVDGVLEVSVNDDGTIDPITVEGDFELSTVTLRIVNAAKLQSADALHATGRLVGMPKAVVTDDNRSYRVKVVEGALRVACCDGCAIVIR